MKQKYSFTMLLLPFSILSVLASILLVQRTGISYKTTLSYGNQKLLPQENVEVAGYFADKPVDTLVLYDSQQPETEEFLENVLAILDSMRVRYDSSDIRAGSITNFSGYKTVVVAFASWQDSQASMLALVNWVESGGRALVAIRPIPSPAFSAVYRKFGILSREDDLVLVGGVEYKTDLLPGSRGLSLLSNQLNQTSYPVELAEDTVIHLVSADDKNIPLLWQSDFGRGRFVFVNSDLFISKEGRGVIGAAYSLLPDVFVYPVINASVFFIDDFPSPVPAGSTELIEEQFGMTIQDFYTNVWWPDMLGISKRYNIRYTGVMIETYDHIVAAPFEKELNNERHRYFGSSLLATGGEVGLHGRNHVPLCLDQMQVNQVFEYPGWPTTESMQLSVYELFRFAKSLFPDNEFVTYVPPSNILCSDARLWLPAVMPELKVIASLYINDARKISYEQEFTEASDGMIELPRIASDYDISEESQFAIINELGLHFVNSHFVHPDDVLDPDRGALKGWAVLRESYEEYTKWLADTVPGLRNMTAREAAIAIQRFARLAVKTSDVDGALEIELGNFYDEAWLMLRADSKPVSIEGGTITPVTSNLYLIQATKSKVLVRFEQVQP
ncbi:MAG TPA: DUF2194 domain-containing protein [Anaerolineales bacterium]|nr:DUF2194 domain-containing protein [Anaerolineales bacterium]